MTLTRFLVTKSVEQTSDELMALVSETALDLPKLCKQVVSFASTDMVEADFKEICHLVNHLMTLPETSDSNICLKSEI
jgi:hypothetical protein